MDVEVRTIDEGEFEAWYRAVDTAFGGHFRPEELELERTVLDPERCLAAVEGGEIVGGAASILFDMTVPGGGSVRTAGISAVGVKPTHRRRGVNTALMRHQLDAVREEGLPVAALFASEGAIYGRFGYGLAALACSIELETTESAFVRGVEPVGRVRLLEREEARPQIMSVFDRSRRTRPGTMALDEAWFDYVFADKRWGEERHPFFAVHDSGEGSDGYAVYRVKTDWSGSVPNSTIEIEALDALAPAAYASVWRYVLDVDLIRRVHAWARPVDEPLLHLLREPRRLNLRAKDGLWIRPVEVVPALEARRYGAPGRLVLEVVDRFCPWNDGRYELEAGAEGASCRRTDRAADLALTINELGAACLGGTSFRQLHRAGRVEEERTGALARADAMFGTDPAPWCPLFF